MVAEKGNVKCININIHRKICKDKMGFFKYLSNFPFYLKTHFVYVTFFMYILASMERSFKFRLNDTRLFLTHSVLIENDEFS